MAVKRKASIFNDISLRKKSSKTTVNSKAKAHAIIPEVKAKTPSSSASANRNENSYTNSKIVEVQKKVVSPNPKDKINPEEVVAEAPARPPPMNSTYLPLPWRGRLGYVRCHHE